MGDKELSYNCRLALTKNETKTSTQIGLPYSPARTVTYEKVPMGRIPKIRAKASVKVGEIYIPPPLKSIYRESYTIPFPEGGYSFTNSKALKQIREYSKLGSRTKPIKFGMSEYGREYTMKSTGPCTQGISVGKLSTCPLELTGRDERDPLPLTENYGKYLDIYVSTTRSTHRAFTLMEQKGIAAKDIVTSQETMGIPKGRGFGCKFPFFPGQDLDNRDENMTDKVLFASKHKLRFLPKGMPKVPNFGSESEIQSAYKQPTGIGLTHIFDRFIEFPETINSQTAKQALCPPGMYRTESSVIHNHTSPQTVV